MRALRKNGLVKVPPSWFPLVNATFNAGGGVVYLPIGTDYPYPQQIPNIVKVFPQGIPLQVAALPLGFSTRGSLGKKGSGFILSLQPMTGSDFVSTLRHELRHLMQHIGDVGAKLKKEDFGRPKKADKTALRARRKAMKIAGKAQGMGYYFTAASEWQPWVGSVADEVVALILKAIGKKPGAKLDDTKLNHAIRTALIGSAFYKQTAPETRKALLRQGYTEVLRRITEELEGQGYIFIPPKPKPVAASAPSPFSSVPGVLPSGAYRVVVKIKKPKDAKAAKADPYFWEVNETGSYKYALFFSSEAAANAGLLAIKVMMATTPPPFGGQWYDVQKK